MLSALKSNWQVGQPHSANGRFVRDCSNPKRELTPFQFSIMFGESGNITPVRAIHSLTWSSGKPKNPILCES
jgi:hypothetical protein